MMEPAVCVSLQHVHLSYEELVSAWSEEREEKERERKRERERREHFRFRGSGELIKLPFRSGPRRELNRKFFWPGGYTSLWSSVTRSALVPLESVAILETVRASSSLCQSKQLSSGLHTRSSQSYSPAHVCVLFCICRAYFNHIEHVTLA